MRVLVDNEAVEPDADGALTLQLGERLIELRADGFERERRKLVVMGGDEQKLSFNLRAVHELAPAAAATATMSEPHLAAPAQAFAEPPADAAGKGLWASPWLWTCVGLVAAGTIATVVAVNSHSSNRHAAPPVTTDNTPKGLLVMALESR